MEGGDGAWSAEARDEARRCNEDFAAGRLEPCGAALERLAAATGGDVKVRHNAAVCRFLSPGGGDAARLFDELERLTAELDGPAPAPAHLAAATPAAAAAGAPRRRADAWRLLRPQRRRRRAAAATGWIPSRTRSCSATLACSRSASAAAVRPAAPLLPPSSPRSGALPIRGDSEADARPPPLVLSGHAASLAPC